MATPETPTSVDVLRTQCYAVGTEIALLHDQVDAVLKQMRATANDPTLTIPTPPARARRPEAA